jgi:muramidase (phage lysozyme)
VYKEQLHLPDFSPLSQDKVALQQMKERDAIDFVVNGDVSDAIHICSNIWASFPGNNYSQPGGKTLAVLVAQYKTIVA